MATQPRLVRRDDDLLILDNEAEDRYEAWLDGEPAGLLEYTPQDGWLVLDHTEVMEAFEGRGVGSRLVVAVLDDIRARGLLMNPQCPFVVSWIKRHRDYRDLIVGVRGPRPQ